MSSSEQIQTLLQNVEIRGKVDDSIQKILTPEAVAFVATLHRTFEPTRRKLIQAREERQRLIDAGKKLDFLPETKHVRDDPTWQGPKLAPGLVDRRVEITGPTDRKMVINALNSDVATYMADFEDSSTPTWENMASGQVNLYDAARRQVDFTQAGGKSYKLRTDRKLPTLIVRPRGWHLLEKHLIVDGEPIAGAFFDFGLYFFHNAKVLIAEGYGPYFYLPKMESYLEARLWNDVFNVAQDTVGIPRGTIRGTVLIETIHAAYQMDEIIYELRQHSSGLNCGRWDYIFSTIKTFRNHKDFILPDRSDVTMTVPFMNAYVQLLIQTCHKRGVDAMGGMAAQIPIKNDAEANKIAMEGVYKDKIREATAGHDGTWVAHPHLAHIANEVFNRYMPTPNQIFKRNEDVVITAADLVNTKFEGKITIEGIRKNLFIGLNYIEAWLRGIGCVPINYLMEDAATAEVSRSQLWQWAKHGAKTADGQTVTPELNIKILREEVAKLDKTAPAGNKFKQAAQIFEKQITGHDYTLFLPSLLYDDVVKLTAPAKL